MINLSKLLNSVYLARRDASTLFFSIFSFLGAKIYLAILVMINSSCWFFARYIDSEIDQAQIALHYSVDFGIDLYGDINKIYILPLLGTIIAVINFIILAVLFKYSPKDANFNLHLLFLASIISNIMLCGAIISIYFINF